jgi:hypothetical protein
VRETIDGQTRDRSEDVRAIGRKASEGRSVRDRLHPATSLVLLFSCSLGGGEASAEVLLQSTLVTLPK